jgi:hypothetical protein
MKFDSFNLQYVAIKKKSMSLSHNPDSGELVHTIVLLFSIYLKICQFSGIGFS